MCIRDRVGSYNRVQWCSSYIGTVIAGADSDLIAFRDAVRSIAQDIISSCALSATWLVISLYLSPTMCIDHLLTAVISRSNSAYSLIHGRRYGDVSGQ